MIKVIIDKDINLPLIDEENFTFSTLSKIRKNDLNEINSLKSLTWINEENFNYLIKSDGGKYKIYFKLSPTKSKKVDTFVRNSLRIICVQLLREYRLSSLLDK